MLNLNPENPYMTDEDWIRVRHFTRNENWGNWRKLHKNLIFLLDAFREFAGRPFRINCAFADGGHTDGSYHYRGMAVDGHFEGLHIVDQFLLAERFDEFNGIGLYPWWNSPGLHLDIRPHTCRFQPDSRWVRNREGVYVPLSKETIKEMIQS